MIATHKVVSKRNSPPRVSVKVYKSSVDKMAKTPQKGRQSPTIPNGGDMPAEGYGPRLQRLRERSELRVEDIAKKLEMSPTGYRRYENDELYVKELIPASFMIKLLPILVGQGDPPITVDDLLSISELKGVSGLLLRAPREDAPLAGKESMGEQINLVGAMSIKYRLAKGVYRDKDALDAGVDLASRVLPSMQYPSEAQWAAVVDDAHGQPFGIPKRAILTCVDISYLAPRSVPAGSVVIVQHERNGLVEWCLGKVVGHTGRGGYILKGTDEQTLEGDVMGAAFQVYGSIAKQPA